MSYLTRTEVTKVIKTWRITVRNDTSTDFLSHLFITNTNYLNISDRWMPHQIRLYFNWIDIFTTPYYHILHSARDLDIPLFVHLSQIARLAPPLFINSLSGLLWVIPVLGHHEIPLHTQFTLDPFWHNIALLVYDLCLHVWVNDTHTGDLVEEVRGTVALEGDW